MSKRFLDTSIWEKEWFMKLPPLEKAAWFYITGRCDNVGVWDANYRLANFILGADVDWDSFATKCNGNVHIMENGKWWLVDYCSFQHPDLDPNSTSKPIISYINALKRHGLWDENIGFANPIQRVCIASKEKEREKEREREEQRVPKKGKVLHPELDVPVGETRYRNLCDEWGQDVVDEYIQRVIDWSDGKGVVTKDYAARAATFIAKDVEAGKLTKPKPHVDEATRLAELRRRL